MPTINAGRVGNIIAFNSNFTTARQTAGTVADGTFSVNGGSRIIYFNPSNDHIVHT